MMADHFDWEAICSRAIEAQDVYAEIPKIIADLRAENIRRGGDDRTFAVLICGLLGQITLPCLRVESL